MCLYSRPSTEREDGGLQGGRRETLAYAWPNCFMYVYKRYTASKFASYAGGRSSLCGGSRAHYAALQKDTDSRQEQAGLTSTCRMRLCKFYGRPESDGNKSLAGAYTP